MFGMLVNLAASSREWLDITPDLVASSIQMVDVAIARIELHEAKLIGKLSIVSSDETPESSTRVGEPSAEGHR